MIGRYTADFETTTDENDCRVWAYALCNIDDPTEFIYGNNIDDFFDFCSEHKTNLKIWFHNLKFDSAFLLDYLFTHSFEYIKDRKDKRDFTFTTLITDMGQFYSIEVYFSVKGKKVNKVTFMDSLKIFPNFSVEKVAKGFNLPISKLELDYNAKRPIGHELTVHEIEYIRNDVEIMARALNVMFNQGLNKMTIASDAFSYFKNNFIGFRKKFPKLPEDVDSAIRKSYRGGFTYVNDVWREKPTGKGIVLDVNSLYPYCMTKTLPYSFPVLYEGEYEYDPDYPLYIQNFSCVFDIKEGKIPTIQLKNNLSFIPNEYVKSSNNKIVNMTLTKPDYELFLEHYNVRHITCHGGWKFKASDGYFSDYINHWIEQKIKASKEGNQPLRQISKLMLNSLYGRFAISGKCRQKSPMLDEDGVLRFILEPEETRDTVYVPVAAFITAYGRERTIRTSQAIRDFTIKKYGEDRYYYSDTDSCHANLSDEDLEELKDIIQIDDYQLGFWAREGDGFDRGMFIRQKCYAEEKEGKLTVTVAGLPKYLAPLITFDNFKKGFTTKGLTIEEMIEIASNNNATIEEIKKLHHKFRYKYVKGGVILADTDFTIK